ncbi:unnamed protein product, partial [marine sediment metagenome]
MNNFISAYFWYHIDDSQTFSEFKVLTNKIEEMVARTPDVALES